MLRDAGHHVGSGFAYGLAPSAFALPVSAALRLRKAQNKIQDPAKLRRLIVVEEQEAVVTTKLQRAIRLRQAVLQKAFAGEL